YLILGHEHPSITLRDSVGRLGKFSCFLVGEISNLNKVFVTLPATGAYQTGSRITLDKETYISPILRENASIPNIKPVIVDEEIGVFELPQLKDIAEYLYTK
ncbi:MAG: phosphoesterase, partial [Zestosphaera sp.]